LCKLKGKPLIWYSIQAAKGSKLLTRWLVSTDGVDIAAVAERYGAEVPFLRPPSMATDTCRIELALKHALEFVEHQERVQYDLVVLLQNSSSLRTSEDIDWCLNLLYGHMKDADSVACAYLVDHEDLKLR
jgi:CMP-N-acetylneuraminic acid synthetase